MEYSSSTNPRSWLNNGYDNGGVGLGIVVALDKCNNVCNGGENILAKYALFDSFSTRSVSTHLVSTRVNENKGGEDDDDVEMMEGLEEYTYVTCYGPNNLVTTRVYHEGGGGENGNTVGGSGSEICGESCGVLKVSEGRLFGDFLSACQLCRKSLHGKDIYMYRGENAFCSTECREKQIAIDERKEQCRSGASRSVDVSGSAYTCSTSEGQISLGILAV